MAGKTKKQPGGQSQTPRTPRQIEAPKTGPLGHMGLKSSPYAPTDCKLVSQYMVMDRMAAHYKKVNKAKAAVDTTPPKAWLVSTKMRDQARREAIKGQEKKMAAWEKQRPHSARARSYSGSDVDRDEIRAMMDRMDDYGGYDEVGGRLSHRVNTSMDVHPSNSDLNQAPVPSRSDMSLVNKILDDSQQSPSKYTTNKRYTSNIPSPGTPRRGRSPHGSTKVVAQKPLYKTQMLDTYTTPNQYSSSIQMYDPALVKATTPRSGDVMELHNDKFTEEKPFQPRTLKSNRTSKLSQFKYYNPPKRKTDEETQDHEPQESRRPISAMSAMRSSLKSRPGTADTDLMSETIMSRDYSDHTTPSGVPKLDISLDPDHFNWLKDQSKKAMLRSASARTQSDDLGSTRGEDMMDTSGMNGTFRGGGTFTLNGSLRASGSFGDKTARDLAKKEEELQYLSFIQDVTNDVLDRGIFTNRVLKQVFESHVIRRRHQLKEEKMREMLEDLRIDLGIPVSDDDDPEGLGLTSTWSSTRNQRRSRQDAKLGTTSTLKKTLPNLHSRNTTSMPNRGRTPSPEGKPPLPKPGTKGASKSHLDSTMSSLGQSQEMTAKDGDSVFGTVTDVYSSSADILKVDHEETQLGQSMELSNGTHKAEELANGNTLHDEDNTLLYQQQLQASLDRDTSELSELSQSESNREYDTQRSGQPVSTGRTENSYPSDSETPREAETQRTDQPVYTERTDDVQYTDRTQSDYLDRASDRGADTERTSHYSDDYEEEITPRRNVKTPKSPKSHQTPRRRRREANDSARSMDHTTASESVEVSELDEEDNYMADF